MFGKLKGMTDQLQMMRELMKNEDFKALISHPKVQEVFMDPEFQKIVMEKDLAKVMTHPKFAFLMNDPEVAKLMLKFKAGGFPR